MPDRTELDHALQLRLPKTTVADIDDVIATIPQLCGFNRCRFIRNAVRYALDSIVEETRPAKNEQRRTTQNEETAN
jgi:hypothetical protein